MALFKTPTKRLGSVAEWVNALVSQRCDPGSIPTGGFVNHAFL